MDNDIFDCNIKIKDGKEFIDEDWAIIEEFSSPTTYISSAGYLLFIFKEDYKGINEKWILIIPKYKSTILKFLKREITYQELVAIEDIESYIVNWDIKKDELNIEREVDVYDLDDIPNITMIPINCDLISKIIKTF